MLKDKNIITNNELKNFIKLRGKWFVKEFIFDLAELHYKREILQNLEKGTSKYKALEITVRFNEELMFEWNINMPIITKEESELLRDIPNASDELIEEYKKRVDEIIKEMWL